MELRTKDVQFNGFRQVWSERPDGVFHGEYTVFWESGPVICMRGVYANGRQEGVWTYWDRRGMVERQVKSEHDIEVETHREAPWWESVTDQDLD